MAIDITENNHLSEVETWRQRQEDSLRSEDGWLTVVGLEWLHEGENSIGSVKSEVMLPAGAPDKLGSIHLENGQVTLTVTTEMPVMVNGAAAQTALLYDATLRDRPPVVVSIGTVTFFIIQRGEQFAVRIKDRNSVARQTFGGRFWFPVDSAYQLTARFIPHESGRRLQVDTTVGIPLELANPGVLELELQGQPFRVDVFDAGSDGETRLLWLIFRDATSGISTYGAARFLEAPLADDGTAVLDFNKAYHPPCAFTDYATCPLPPRQNILPIAINAGEKLPDTML